MVKISAVLCIKLVFKINKDITFAAYYMRKILIIIFLLPVCWCWSQSNDSDYQKLIDSTRALQKKAEQLLNSSDEKKVKPDTASVAAPVNPIKKDSTVTSQVKDSIDNAIVQPSDTLAEKSILQAEQKPALSWLQDTAFMKLLMIFSGNKNIATNNIIISGDMRQASQNDLLFYSLLALVCMLGLIRQVFPKYFQNMFKLLFQASFRQKQTRDQLMQDKPAAIITNILFILVAGLFIAVTAGYYSWFSIPFWRLSLYCVTILALVYGTKYLVISFAGWVFNAREAAGSYSFIVFMINKISGIALLPMLVVLSFSEGMVRDVVLTVAAGIMIALLALRYIISLQTVKGNMQLNAFHFFIYICAIELMPVLVIYKVLFSLLGQKQIH